MQLNSIFVFTLWVILGFNRVIATGEGIVEDADSAPKVDIPSSTPDTSAYIVVEPKEVSEDADLEDEEPKEEAEKPATPVELELSDALLPETVLKESADEVAIKKFFESGLDAAADKFVASLGNDDELVDKMVDDVLNLMKKYDIKAILETWEDLPASAAKSKKEADSVAALKRKLFMTAFIAEMKGLLDASIESEATVSQASLLQGHFRDDFEEKFEKRMEKESEMIEKVVDRVGSTMGESHDTGEETMKRMVTIFLSVGVAMTLITLACYFFAFKSCLNLAHRAITVRAQNRLAREEAAGNVVPHTAP